MILEIAVIVLSTAVLIPTVIGLRILISYRTILKNMPHWTNPTFRTYYKVIMVVAIVTSVYLLFTITWHILELIHVAPRWTTFTYYSLFYDILYIVFIVITVTAFLKYFKQ